MRELSESSSKIMKLKFEKLVEYVTLYRYSNDGNIFLLQ